MRMPMGMRMGVAMGVRMPVRLAMPVLGGMGLDVGWNHEETL